MKAYNERYEWVKSCTLYSRCRQLLRRVVSSLKSLQVYARSGSMTIVSDANFVCPEVDDHANKILLELTRVIGSDLLNEFFAIFDQFRRHSWRMGYLCRSWNYCSDMGASSQAGAKGQMDYIWVFSDLNMHTSLPKKKAYAGEAHEFQVVVQV